MSKRRVNEDALDTYLRGLSSTHEAIFTQLHQAKTAYLNQPVSKQWRALSQSEQEKILDDAFLEKSVADIPYDETYWGASLLVSPMVLLTLCHQSSWSFRVFFKKTHYSLFLYLPQYLFTYLMHLFLFVFSYAIKSSSSVREIHV